jgi:hypothetical protein
MKKLKGHTEILVYIKDDVVKEIGRARETLKQSRSEIIHGCVERELPFLGHLCWKKHRENQSNILDHQHHMKAYYQT